MSTDGSEDRDRSALDELFSLTSTYRSREAFHDLMTFISRFQTYAPYNAMLIHVQRPGAYFVATAERWRRLHDRTIKPGARPMVILQPMGPVLFVFDASDTEGGPLPDEVVNPFRVSGSKIGNKFSKIIDCAMRDGVRVHYAALGSQSGGSIGAFENVDVQQFRKQSVPVRYSLELNQGASPEENFAALAHELAHLYCGHLGSPDPRWWPSRPELSHQIEEIEAESVAYLVTSRFGIRNLSESYLSDYLGASGDMPPISVEAILKAAGLIERMATTWLPYRKPEIVSEAGNNKAEKKRSITTERIRVNERESAY